MPNLILTFLFLSFTAHSKGLEELSVPGMKKEKIQKRHYRFSQDNDAKKSSVHVQVQDLPQEGRPKKTNIKNYISSLTQVRSKLFKTFGMSDWKIDSYEWVDDKNPVLKMKGQYKSASGKTVIFEEWNVYQEKQLIQATFSQRDESFDWEKSRTILSSLELNRVEIK